jgi:hypothetical protein
MPGFGIKDTADSGRNALEKTNCTAPNHFYTNKMSILKGNRQGFGKKL